ncbi:tetratricopeptide repeat protein, partial [uncultured Porphyromonas sp.]|uniref:tetratricopeptide repeat protein n=1 Tax=uncultured Porphyromonas sp. TaxID=159274 RepID=UPI0026024D74
MRDLTRSGNKLYRSEEYSKAEIDYRKALEINKSDPTTIFNLANVLYRTDRGEEAGKLYQSLAPHLSLLSPTEAADLTHNAGNTAFRAKQLEQAIE